MTELEKAAATFSAQNTWNDYSSFIAGAQWAFQGDVERILCAACKYKIFDEEIVTMGFRHDQSIAVGDRYFWNWKLHSAKNREMEDFLHAEFRESEIQGFLTSKNRFVDREEGARIAFSAGQIMKPKEELYSEDLY